jgi:hypothetical protein
MEATITLPAVELAAKSLIDYPIHKRPAADQLFYSFFNNEQIPLVDFKPTWANGTGYFDGVCRDKELAATMRQGEIRKFVGGSARPALIVMTTKGPLVFFQRYTDQGPITYNAPFDLFRYTGHNNESIAATGYRDEQALPESDSGAVNFFTLAQALVHKSLSQPAR